MLQKEIFPELAQKFFGGSGSMEYYVAVRDVGREAGQVIYSSGTGISDDKNRPVDATLNLLDRLWDMEACKMPT